MPSFLKFRLRRKVLVFGLLPLALTKNKEKIQGGDHDMISQNRRESMPGGVLLFAAQFEIHPPPHVAQHLFEIVSQRGNRIFISLVPCGIAQLLLGLENPLLAIFL